MENVFETLGGMLNPNGDKKEDTGKPLWKELNEKRTKGEWYNSEKKRNERMKDDYFNIGTKSGEIVSGLYKTVGFYYPHSLQNEEEQHANVEYTTLAVNNLHILAEALLPFASFAMALFDLESTDNHTGTYVTLNGSKITYEDLIRAIKAIKSIS